MSYFINPVEDDGCVFLSYEGELPPVEFSAARYEANGVLDRQHWNRMVIDVTQLQSVLTPPQLFSYAKALSSDVPLGARVALVVRPEQVRSVRLVERVASNDGVSVTCFLDPEEATDWVKQTKPPRRTVSRNRKEKP